MALDLVLIIIIILLGIGFGCLATIAGVGGGVFWVPIMTIAMGMPIDEAIDTSTFVILISSFAGFISYLKQKRTNLKMSLIFASFSILGGFLCVLFLIFVPLNNEILRILFGILLIITGANMGYKMYKERNVLDETVDESYDLKNHDYKQDLKKGIPFFILAGFVANLLGVGGGIINTPALNMIFGFPIHNATAISTSIIFFTAISNTTLKAFMGKINYLMGILLSSGSVIGALIGAKISKKMPKKYLQLFVAIILAVLGINMLI